MEIDTQKAQEGTPRPHYLVGMAEYANQTLTGKVYFPSSRDSIGDRAEMQIPHVNIGDVCFAAWNAGHIMAEQEGYPFRILTDEVRINLSRYPIPADQELDLEVTAEANDLLEDSNGRLYRTGSLECKISQGDKLLIKVNAGVFIRP